MISELSVITIVLTLMTILLMAGLGYVIVVSASKYAEKRLRARKREQKNKDEYNNSEYQ